MALRAVAHEEEEEVSKKSGISGLSTYWQDAKRQPPMDWDRWKDLFYMAVMGKHSIQIREIIRVIPADQNQNRNQALMGGHTVAIAEQKVISILYLSLGGAANN